MKVENKNGGLDSIDARLIKPLITLMKLEYNSNISENSFLYK